MLLLDHLQAENSQFVEQKSSYVESGLNLQRRE